MPQTIAYRTTSEEGEYEASTDTEVSALVEAYEAASAVLAAFDAANPAPEYVYRARVSAEEYAAYEARLEALQAERRPLELATAAARRALSESRNLPIGTVVSFRSSEGWGGSTTDEGVITKVTPTSYVVDKIGYLGSSGTARLNREHAHTYRSSYSNSLGGRSMAVVRTPGQQQAYVQQQAAARREEATKRALQQAQWDAERAVQDARLAQQGILREAEAKALRLLIQRHAEEYASMVTTALDLLALDAPGREATVLPETT